MAKSGSGILFGVILLIILLLTMASSFPGLPLILVGGGLVGILLWKMISGPARDNKYDLAEISFDQEAIKAFWRKGSAPSPVRQTREMAKENAKDIARAWLGNNVLILDTETTGLDERAEVVDIALIDCSGTTLLDTIVRPTIPTPLELQSVHGITDEMLRASPTWADIHGKFCRLIDGRTVVIYNREFDLRILKQTMAAHGLPVPDMNRFECVMLNYAMHYGSWNSYRGDYRWHKLVQAASHQGVKVEGALRAKGDCLMTLGVIRAMAAEPKKKMERVESDSARLKRFKQDGRLDEAETFLLGLVAATESTRSRQGVSPWGYEQLGILYRKQKRNRDEVEILKRYARQEKAPGVGQAMLAERLIKAEALLAKAIKTTKDNKKGFTAEP